VASLGLAACAFFSVPGQQRLAAEHASVSGTVEGPAGAKGPLIVALATTEGARNRLVDYFVAEQPGPWVFAVEPGTYWLAAFEDANGDHRYRDEPALAVDRAKPVVLEAGARMTGIDLKIPADGRLTQEFELQALLSRTPDEQDRRSLLALSNAGVVTTLDNPRFSRDNATNGMWRYYDFVVAENTGIYFLEPYDPARVPVLFVHGMNGTPLDFRELIDSLDRSQFQPWVFYYPTGAKLDNVAALLTQLFSRLRVEYGFERAAVVAHSMGGIVTRSFVLRDFEASRSKAIRTYVTISSPLGGMESAAAGVERSPIVVHSWRDIAPHSAFLDGLFFHDVPQDTERRRLPAHIAYHMLYGTKGESGDGVVSLESALRKEAQEEAKSVRSFDEDHTSILSSAPAAAFLNEVLAAR
jgi:pimeloyl-ACP methyl ester carboxylesterase